MTKNNKKPIAFILGPTASGKTDLAINICNSIPAEIISVDSVMVYKDCDIGSAKPSKDILLKHKHHLVDCIEPEQIYSVADFYESSLKLITEIHNNNKLPLFVGGSMMYFKSLIYGLDNLPERNDKYRNELEKIKNENGIDMLYKMLKESDPKYAKQVNNSDEKRIIRALEVVKASGNNFSSMVGYKNKDYLVSNFSIHQFGIFDEDRSLLHSRIEERLEMIIQNGLIDEVKGLLNKYKIPENHPIRKSVNYKQAISFLNKEYDSEEFFKRALYATRQLAKRQMTWLRSWDDLNVFNLKTSYKIEESIKRLLTSL
ncbi:tRNA (adenosine(37)-N6)-dimethylallyltransferase MiaA [Gammaproteobacteria bacterium]|nr:tRNA (adenosine(37)-N6)-dimethylallyltransferase MiaA [Gammaproteobacteria bacterium]MDG2093630.1 tRNA (adenosine(37)-N6)-dimethylallyltransferase MiaA [SAR86 cluster bacterium]